MKDFTKNKLIKEAADWIINNYKIGYTDLNSNICFINPKKYEPGQTAYNILNPELFITTPQIRELFEQIDQYTSQAETCEGELFNYNRNEKNRATKALIYELKKYYLFSEIEKNYIIKTYYNKYFIVDDINNSGTIKAHDKQGRMYYEHVNNIIKYKAPGRPTQTNKLFKHKTA